MSRDLTNYEYEGLVNHITQLYKDKPGIGGGHASATGQMLIELLADATDNLHYMLERRSQETYTSIARLRSSVWAAVSSVGYRPRRAVSATGTLRLELQDNNGDPKPAEGKVHIPYGKRVTFEGETFIVNGDYVIPRGATSIEIQIKEGRLEEQIINFNAEPYKTDNYFTLQDYTDIEEFSMIMAIDNTTYEDVNAYDDGLRIRAISFADKHMPVYDLMYYRNGLRVVFGDGTFGKKPEGDMYVSWVRSSGGKVHVVSTEREFKFEQTTLTDDVLVTPANEYQYSLTNITPIRGGRDEESIEEIKENVTAFVRSNDRAVTNFDYEFWVRRSGIGDIADVKVYGEHETNRLIFTMNNVYISYATNDGFNLNPTQQQQLRDYIGRLKMNTTHLVFRPVDKIYLALDVDFKRHHSLPISNSQLYRVLVERINEYFKVKRGTIGKGFQHSEFVEYLQNLRFEFNSIVYPMTDFVKVDVTGMVPFSIPQPAYDGVIEVSPDYQIVANDVWNVTIDDQTFTVVTTSTDSVPTMIDKMMAEIFKGTRLMLAKPQPNQIRIAHPEDTGVFTISVGSGNLAPYVTFKQFIQIPRPANTYNANVDQLLPESVDIVDENGNVLMEDDGTGSLINQTGNYAAVVIDYADCRFQNPSLPDDDYYIRFQQNEFQNFDVTDEGLITVMPFRSSTDSEEVHFFSNLNIL